MSNHMHYILSIMIINRSIYISIVEIRSFKSYQQKLAEFLVFFLYIYKKMSHNKGKRLDAS